MCGIFGIIGSSEINKEDLEMQAKYAERRGKDSSGIIYHVENNYKCIKSDYKTTNLVKELREKNIKIVIGHSRLITNGMNDNQPVIQNNVAVFHNGIIVNSESIWKNVNISRKLEIDTEIIAAIVTEGLQESKRSEDIYKRILSLCDGTMSCALLIASRGELLLFSNNGSLYLGKKDGNLYFASEENSLNELDCKEITQVKELITISVPKTSSQIETKERKINRTNLIPSLSDNNANENLLKYSQYKGIRCTKCILPATMPYISFDEKGVCNYCRNHTPRNTLRPITHLEETLKKYRTIGTKAECIVPFSGGRDSTYALHIIKNELGLKPITFTYDWGMVTDLARRNISRMCYRLGVENIIVADDIKRKRDYIRMNLYAWLKKPNLGMLNLLMAGDKHFFRYLTNIQKETGIELNIWGMCPLETTHFKAGFLGIPPYFEETHVYTTGLAKQIRYQAKRLVEVAKNPKYINRSVWDTLSGEYYRSVKSKKGYFHLFDYYQWKENQVNTVLQQYDWEKAPDTDSTWRIGDGTAAFYNYVYQTAAGFTEHDTFRSNQIREGDITRQEALNLIIKENAPRYQNIKWYLDTLGVDYQFTISTINAMKKLYEE